MNESLYEIGVIIFKTIALAVSIAVIFKCFQLASSLLDWIFKRLPKPILIIIGCILFLLVILLKLAKFGVV